MTIQLIEVYKTSDGEYFEKEEEARAHEANLEFMDWCRKNICYGGPWSYSMVARAILEAWEVRAK